MSREFKRTQIWCPSSWRSFKRRNYRFPYNLVVIQIDSVIHVWDLKIITTNYLFSARQSKNYCKFVLCKYWIIKYKSKWIEFAKKIIPWSAFVKTCCCFFITRGYRLLFWTSHLTTVVWSAFEALLQILLFWKNYTNYNNLSLNRFI